MRAHRAPRRRGDDTGFTLVELLAVISILGIISYPLTESVILGLRTTDATAASSSRSVAIQTLSSYFTGDAQSAEEADLTAADVTAPGGSCGTTKGFLFLSWTDKELRRVSYSLVDPGTASALTLPAPEQELVRWSCTGNGAPAEKVLGQFSRVPDPLKAAVSAECDPDCTSPTSIRLKVAASEPELTLTVSRRRTPSP